MSKIKSWMMDLEEQFNDKALNIIKDSEFLNEALKRIEELRAKEYNWMDEDDVAGMAEDAWSDYYA
mgnify:CR=1 FL=1